MDSALDVQLSEGWTCGFLEQSNGSRAFWIAHKGATYTFASGVGHASDEMGGDEISADLCAEVADYLDLLGVSEVSDSTFWETYDQAFAAIAIAEEEWMSGQTEEEYFWIEQSGNFIPVPYTVTQVREMLSSGCPPASLDWLLRLDEGLDSFKFQAEWGEEWIFSYSSYQIVYCEQQWTLEVTKDNLAEGYQVAVAFPWEWQASNKRWETPNTLTVKSTRDGFIRGWTLPYEYDFNRKCLTVWARVALSKYQHHEKELAFLNCGYQSAQPLPYWIDEENTLIVCEEVEGWAPAWTFDFHCEQVFEETGEILSYCS